MSKIISIRATEIIDSRGEPTIEVSCELENAILGVASVPSGKSTGIYEACELRDKDSSRFNGRGVLKAVSNVNTEICDHIKDKEFSQSTLDQSLIKLDGA